MNIGTRTLVTVLGTTTLAAALVSGAGNATASTESVASWALGSAAGSAGAAGLPIGSIAGDTCWGLEPATLLPMTLRVAVEPERENGEARLYVHDSGISQTSARYTLAWQNPESGQSGEIMGETLLVPHTGVEHRVPVEPGQLNWQITAVSVWSEHSNLLGQELPMSLCAGSGHTV